MSLPTYFTQINFNIILPSMSGSSKCYPSLRFFTKTLYAPLLSPIRATRLAHLSLLDHLNDISEKYGTKNRWHKVTIRNNAFFSVTPYILEQTSLKHRPISTTYSHHRTGEYNFAFTTFAKEHNHETIQLCAFSGYHSGLTENLRFLECDAS